VNKLTKIFTALTSVLSDLLMKGNFSTSIGMRNCGVLQFKNKTQNKTKPPKQPQKL